MDWPAAAVLIIAALCATACYLAPFLAPLWAPKPATERTAAIGFHVPREPDDD